MTLANLNQLDTTHRAIAGLVCLGWPEVRAYTAAAEAMNGGVALMVGPGARADMPLNIWAEMLSHAVKNASVPIATHLDHGASLDDVKWALDLGFSSVMYDGSKLPLAENIHTTRQVAELAKQYGASSEGEIGYVGYANGAQSSGTDAAEARTFAAETGVDFMAVSVGNVHLQTTANAEPNWELLTELATINTPLVVHGGSGFSHATRQKMARNFNVRKFNIGTELRQVFGKSLRQSLHNDADVFDHLTIFRTLHDPLVEAAKQIITGLNFKT